MSGRVTPKPLDAPGPALPRQVHAELLAGRATAWTARAATCRTSSSPWSAAQLYLLQSRPAKRTARAAVRIAVALVDEGTITPAEAVRRVTPEQVRTLLAAGASPRAPTTARSCWPPGIAASPGVGTGIACGHPRARRRRRRRARCWSAASTSPDDVHGMIAAVAVVTEQGGATSHAAVVSRALDTPCVVGCGPGTVDALVGQDGDRRRHGRPGLRGPSADRRRSTRHRTRTCAA